MRSILLATLLSMTIVHAVPAQQSFVAGATFHPGRDAASVETSSILHVLGGAVIGAWIGYFASQVAVSDWDNIRVDRFAWAAGGAVVGSLSGFAVSTAFDGPAALPRGIPVDARNVITTAEIRQSGKQSVYEVISSLRPEWLIIRGVHSMQETPKGIGVGRAVVITDPGTPTIKVYLDEVQLGGADELRRISPAEVTVVEYLSPARASQRFGAGHSHGAIVVHTN